MQLSNLTSLCLAIISRIKFLVTFVCSLECALLGFCQIHPTFESCRTLTSAVQGRTTLQQSDFAFQISTSSYQRASRNVHGRERIWLNADDSTDTSAQSSSCFYAAANWYTRKRSLLVQNTSKCLHCIFSHPICSQRTDPSQRSSWIRRDPCRKVPKLDASSKHFAVCNHGIFFLWATKSRYLSRGVASTSNA